MYQKILVPLDGSKFAEYALEHVRTIAKGCNVPEVVLLNAESSPFFVVGEEEDFPSDLIGKAKADYESWAKGYLDKVTKDLQQDGITAKSVLIEGYVADTILSYAEKNGVDLIVMSTHGRSGPARWALGSVADKVMRHSKVPVLVVSPSSSKEAKGA